MEFDTEDQVLSLLFLYSLEGKEHLCVRIGIGKDYIHITFIKWNRIYFSTSIIAGQGRGFSVIIYLAFSRKQLVWSHNKGHPFWFVLNSFYQTPAITPHLHYLPIRVQKINISIIGETPSSNCWWAKGNTVGVDSPGTSLLSSNNNCTTWCSSNHIQFVTKDSTGAFLSGKVTD